MSVAIGGFKRRQAKTIQSRRALRVLEPKIVENPKKVLFLRGANTSEVVTDALTDLAAITKPYCKRLKKRNAFHPFEGNQHLEFLGYKNDCSLFCFGSDSKKRHHNLVLGRHFDFHVLDLIELGILAMDRMDMGKTKGQSVGSIGSKPMFVFEGSEFETDPFFVRLKSLLVDYFRGGNDVEVSPDGVDRVIMIGLRSTNGDDAVIAPSDDCVGTKPPSQKGNAVLRFRHYAMMPQSGAGKEKVKLIDIGPNFDLEIRRCFFSPTTDFKNACKVPREALAHMRSTQENVTGDAMGNLRGQLHIGKQDVTELNLRRFKAHRKQPRGDEGAPHAHGGDDGDADDGTTRAPKRRRRVKSGEIEEGGPETDI